MSEPEIETVETEAEEEEVEREKLPYERIGEALRRVPLDWSLVGMIVAIKAVLMIFAVQGYEIQSNQRPESWRGWLELWNHWDAVHYLGIAREGYAATGEHSVWLAFYPLFPWTVRAVALFFGNYLLSAFLVSAAASIAVGLLLQRLARLDYSSIVSRRAVWFLFIFPSSYFLHIGYTESLFLALVLGSFLSARQGRWPLAGVLGALACLTRVNGLLLIPALAAEVFTEYRATRKLSVSYAWAALVPLGFLGYLWLNKHVTGDALAFLTIQREHWFKSLTWPWVGIGDAFRSIWRSPSDAQMVGFQESLFVAIGFIATIWAFRKTRLSYALWMACNWLLWTSTSFVLSVPRYTLILFPLFFLFARLAANRLWRTVITLWSLLYLALFTLQFVQGRWAF